MKANITNDVDDYATSVYQQLKNAGFRVELDLDSEKINYKIRKHSLTKTPIIAVVGKNEAAENKVAIRRLGQESQEILDISDFIAKLSEEIKQQHN